MAYGNSPDNPGTPASSAMGGKARQSNIIHISPDMLPEGMKLNVDDIVEFRVVGPQDEEGDWPVEYNYGEDHGGGEGEGGAAGGEGEGEGGAPWEEDFRKSMSPRNPEEGASY